MNKTKYMMSGGLAFTEKGDMEMLSKKAKKGWHLKSFAFMGYRLQKSTPEDVQYTVDYRSLEDGEREEYLEFFAAAGWEYVCSSYDIHIFKAPTGTKPIYSDRESATDKIDRTLRPVYAIGKFIFPLTLLFMVMMSFLTGAIEQFSRFAFTVSLVLAIPTLMMIVALIYRKKRLRMSKEF